MNANSKCSSAIPLHGSLLRLGERREVAIYLRKGSAWVADFDGGHAELHIASAWFNSGGGRMLAHAQRRDAIEALSPLPEEVVQQIDSLHRGMEEPAIGPLARRIRAAFAAWLRRLSAAVTGRSAEAGSGSSFRLWISSRP